LPAPASTAAAKPMPPTSRVVSGWEWG
jgi:hypothetical protein